MTLVTLHDFETKAGQKKIIMTIHKLEEKVHELNHELDELTQKVETLEKDVQERGTFLG